MINDQRDIVVRAAAGLRSSVRGNAGTHSKKQVRQIADSIRAFGFTNPVLIDESNMILPAMAGSRGRP